MTRTEPPGSTDRGTGLGPTRLLLIVGLPILVALLVVGALVAAAVPFALRGTVQRQGTAAGGATVSATMPDARFELGPSSDGRVHVRMDGWSVGQPRLTVRTEAGRTTIRGECPRFVLFEACSVRLRIALPPEARLSVVGTNGPIVAHDLAGDLRATTTNGSITARAVSGDLVLRSTNGAVRVGGSTSGTVEASTTNGAVDLGFTRPPASVDARTTNGAVTVTVPASAAYAVTARTTNGGVDTSQVRTDPQSRYRIVAQTTNGAVRVAPGNG